MNDDFLDQFTAQPRVTLAQIMREYAEFERQWKLEHNTPRPVRIFRKDWRENNVKKSRRKPSAKRGDRIVKVEFKS